MAVLFSDIYLVYIREIIRLFGVAVIVAGTTYAVYQLLVQASQQRLGLNGVRLKLGNAVILGLEFMVAADIIGSLDSPDYYNVGLLAMIVMIRSILSYFLSRELRDIIVENKRP